MQQIYHSNSKTNVHVREQICKSSKTNVSLAEQFNVSTQTVSKWKNRESMQDRSSRPDNIRYALTELERALAVSIRTASLLPIDEVHEMLLKHNPSISQSSIY